MIRHIKISGIIGGAKVKKTHLSTWRMIFKYFNCVMHNYIKHVIIGTIGCPILNSKTHYNVCNDKGKYCAILWARGNYCWWLDLVIH